jgi:hypothetical protein
MALGIVEPRAGAQPPGTEYLVDAAQSGGVELDARVGVKRGEGKVGLWERRWVAWADGVVQKRDIVLVPQPSNDPDDPLVSCSGSLSEVEWIELSWTRVNAFSAGRHGSAKLPLWCCSSTA